jgi:hypothetical protein
LVEGPSDEIIVNGIAAKLGHPMLGANTQVVPVTGKGQFAETVKFFSLMKKDVFVLADLDGIADENQLINVYSALAQNFANQRGMGSIIEIDRSIRNKFQTLLDDVFQALYSTASEHRYWTDRTGNFELKSKRRATLAALLTTPKAVLQNILSGELLALRTRYDALLDVLASAGCIILRRGTIEDYYSNNTSTGSRGKPDAAALEVEQFESQDEQYFVDHFGDVVRAIKIAAPNKRVDENALLREQLGSLLGAALQIVKPDMSNDELNTRIAINSVYEAPIFLFKNFSSTKEGRLQRCVGVNIVSPLFERYGFPIEVSEHENLTLVIDRMLPSQD